MARPGLLRHRKFARLSRLVGSRPLALGHLELLWGAAYEAGDELVGDALDVEALSEWGGAPGKLTEALLGAGFLDETPAGFRIHDLWDHAPDYVRRRQKREVARHVQGTEMQSRSDQRPVGDRSMAGQRPQNVSTPAPAPAPKKQEEEASSLRGGNGSTERTPFAAYLAATWPDIRHPSEFEQVQTAANPGINLLAEARRAQAWELANVKNKKRDHARFLDNWFRRAQDGASRNGVSRDSRGMAPESKTYTGTL